MKYNKQLFDKIEKEYSQLLNLAEFIYDQMLDKNDEMVRYDILSNFDIYAQSVLTNVVLKDNPKNPALFNMIKKLNKYSSFYQGINLDDWFSDKTKVLTKITDKINNCNANIPTLVILCVEADNKSKTTELSYQLLEGLISFVMILKEDAANFEEVEKTILNDSLKNVYDYINNPEKTF